MICYVKNNIRDFMVSKNLGLAYLSYVTGIPHRTLQVYVNNVVQPSIEDLFRIAHVLCCSINDLVEVFYLEDSPKLSKYEIEV